MEELSLANQCLRAYPDALLSLSFQSRMRKLTDLGIGPEEAEELRFRLSAFAEDWDKPEMDVYDVD